jgi:3-oxoacyl-[acyl-carrier protein] reductase
MNKKVMLITGTSRGIGAALADHYKDNYTVIGCGRTDIDVDYDYIVCNITNNQSVLNLFKEIKEKYGKIDILINNSGIAAMNHSLLTPIETATRVFNTNVIGMFNITKNAVRLMPTGGRIVNLTSIAVPLALEGESVYASSKSSVETFTKILSKEYEPFKITVNAVGPAVTQTALVSGVSTKIIGQLLNKQTIKDWCQLSDISNVIDFFVREESKQVTGQIIYLGGVS